MARNLGWSFGRTPGNNDKELAELEQRLTQQKNKEQQRTPKNIVTPTINDCGNFWRILNMPYRRKIYTADLSNCLLDNGEYRTQEGWAEFRKIAEPRGEFYTVDMPTQYAIFSTIANCQGQEAQEAREFIKKQISERWLVTLTRVVYNTQGKDDVFHNWGLNDRYESQVNFVGPDQFIKEIKDVSYLEALLGTRDIQKINEVFQAINGTDTYIFRINSTPKTQPAARVAGFSASSGRTDLYCDWVPSDADASLGIRLIENKTNGGQNK